MNIEIMSESDENIEYEKALYGHEIVIGEVKI